MESSLSNILTPQVNKQDKDNETKREVVSFLKILEEANSCTVPVSCRNMHGELLDESGSVSHLQNELHWKISRTPLFKKWFGNSVVRHENGEPKIVYRIDPNLQKLELDDSVGHGFEVRSHEWARNNFGKFFTSDLRKAWDFQKDLYKDKNVKDFGVSSVFLRLENPYKEEGWTELSQKDKRLISVGDFVNRFYEGGEGFLKQLQQNHDGLYLAQSTDYGDEYTVLQPDQIFLLPNDISLASQINKSTTKQQSQENSSDIPKIIRKRSFFSRLLKR